MRSATAKFSVGFAVLAALSSCASGPEKRASVPIGQDPPGAPAALPAPAVVPPPPAPAPAEAPVSPAATVEPVVPVAPPAPPPPPIPRGTAVLHIGDSFALAGFAQALKPRFVALGARYEVRSETSTFTTTWSSRMDLLIANNQPDLVIINLGANETENTDPSTHAPAVRRIVKAIGDRPCVWVSPPPWHKDTGIIDVMRENSAPCRFFDSSLLVHEPIARQADHIHPSEAGGAVWAKAFWEWLEAERAPAQEGPALLPGPGLEKPKRGPSPWRLKPAPAEEHRVTPKSSDGRPG